MRITQVQFKTVESVDRLRAIVSVVFDESLIIHDVKIIDGPQGLFVAMPARKQMSHCPHCNTKNPWDAVFCNQCGVKLTAHPLQGRQRAHTDIVHPINAAARKRIEREILGQYILQNMGQYKTKIDE